MIAETMGVPKEERQYIRRLAEKLLYIGRRTVGSAVNEGRDEPLVTAC